MSYYDEVAERLANLKRLVAHEKTSDNPTQNYIDDLNLTIESLETHLKTKPKGYAMIGEQV